MADIVPRLRPPAVARYVPLPLDVIGNTINMLEQKQEAGLEAYNAFNEMRRTLANNQIPVQGRQDIVDQILSDADRQLQGFAESQDFINARPAIISAANRVQNQLAPFIRDYEQYQQAVESIRELREKGEIFTPADEYAAIGEALNAIRSDPNARFSAGPIAPRLDVNEALNEFVKEYDPEGRVEFTPNGFIIRTDEIDENEVRLAARQFLMNDPRFQSALRNDINYVLANEFQDENSVADFAESTFDKILQQEEEIINRNDISVEDKGIALQQIDQAKQMLSSNPREYRAREIQEQIVSSAIEPYATRTGIYSIENITANPYALEDYRHRNRLALNASKGTANGGSIHIAPGRSFQQLYESVDNTQDRINSLRNSDNPEERAEANVLQHRLNVTKDMFYNSVNYDSLGISRQEVEEIRARMDEISSDEEGLMSVIRRDFPSFAQESIPDKAIRAGIANSPLRFMVLDRQLKEEFGEDKVEAFRYLEEQLDDYVKQGHGWSDQVIRADEDDLSYAERVLKREDASDWMSTDLDRKDLHKIWKDLLVTGATTDGTQIEVVYPGDDEIPRTQIRLTPITNDSRDSLGRMLRSFGEVGEGIARERALSSIRIGADFTNVDNTNISFRGSGLDGIVSKVGNETVKVDDIFNIAKRAQPGSAEEWSVLGPALGRIVEDIGTTLTSEELLQGFRGNLTGAKLEEFNRVKSREFVFKSKDAALRTSSVIENLFRGQ